MGEVDRFDYHGIRVAVEETAPALGKIMKTWEKEVSWMLVLMGIVD